MGPRLFGGHAIAQALLAASAMENGDRLPHSLHAHFLKAGSSAHPVRYSVTPLSAGRSFAVRRVDGHQDDRLIFTMTVSFHLEEPGFEHTSSPPFSLDIDAALTRLEHWRASDTKAASLPIVERLQKRPIEIVPIDPSGLFGSQGREPKTAVWMRMREATEANLLIQRALLSYASDMMFLRNALLPHGIRPGSDTIQAASLDHAVWFHETPDFDQWHLFATESPWAGHARGLNRGHFYDLDGRMIATVSQESLMRPKNHDREEHK
ncbi:acyl-CoA thioesterase [Pseudoblastomonas halimionae]|uniref:Acyl-CoA thioesterase II n=1 Tax=Alteriqipengyuania halimionae TaxID=1926630 RepID=A0A6I4U386_9SPHN|nr:acyl-CoA thioesterase domain-containing protein [Alteriqipengyuania halimionae]MXP08952.1 acyl-CoA thioesterase II [Alteriqipengyuania halimionae]